MFKKRKIHRHHIYHTLKTQRLRTGKGKSPWKRGGFLFILFSVACIALGFITLTAAIAVISISLPSAEELKSLSFAESTQIFDRNGEPLYAIHGEENRDSIPLSDIPQHLIDATLAIEDDEFYKHSGFDIIAIIRCAIQNLFGVSSCGGSTITQQFVKNNFLTPERSYIRKLKELILALKLEKNFTKDEILEMYLNKIPYGNNAYGVQLAAQTYFSKNATDLTLAESAILASIPKAPTYYSPYGPQRYSQLLKEFDEEDLEKRNITSEAGLKDEEFRIGLIGYPNKVGEKNTIYIHGRTDVVLNRMVQLGYITNTERTEAWQETQQTEFKAARTNIKAPHFVLYVKELLEEKYGKDLIEQGGLKVYTTLDIELQKKAEEIVQKQAEINATRFNANNASLVSIDPKTGHILAMVGSTDYFNAEIDGNVNIALRPRQPGSAFKPIAYAQAFLNGYGPATVLYDVATKIGQDEPQNFDGEFMGPISIRTAIGQSRNIPAIKTYFLAGRKDPIIELAKKMGITSLDEEIEYGYPLALGSGEVSLLEMVTAYSVFAIGGIKHEITTIIKIENTRGDVLEEWEQGEGKEALDSEVAFLINDILSDTNVSFGQNMQIEGHTVAVKTGTSTKKISKDEIYPSNVWMLGYTTDIVTGVWAGNADGSKLAVDATGYYAAGPIFKAFMQEALQDHEDTPFPVPEKIQKIKISKASGLLPGANTPPDQIIEEYFASFAVPEKLDQAFTVASIDTVTGKIATPYCPKDRIVTKTFRIHHSLLPDQYPDWEEGVQNWVIEMQEKGELKDALPEEVCPLHDATTAARAPTIKILSPKSYTEISHGRIKVETELTAPLGANRVEFYLNDQLQYTEKNPPKDGPFIGYLRVSSLLPSGSEVKIKIIGYDAVEYSASTQITVKLK